MSAIRCSAWSLGVSRSILRKNFSRSTWAWRGSHGLMVRPSRPLGAALGSRETEQPRTQFGFRSFACQCHLTVPGLSCNTAAARAPVHGSLGRALRRQLQPLRNGHLHRRRSAWLTPFHALHRRRQAAFVPVRNPHTPDAKLPGGCRCSAGLVPLTARSARAVPARRWALAACQLRQLDRASKSRLRAPVQTDAERWSGATNLRSFTSQTPRVRGTRRARWQRCQAAFGQAALQRCSDCSQMEQSSIGKVTGCTAGIF